MFKIVNNLRKNWVLFTKFGFKKVTTQLYEIKTKITKITTCNKCNAKKYIYFEKNYIHHPLKQKKNY